jgi:hypothetical protein
MKIKTSELTGPALDWAVAKSEGCPVHSPDWNNRFIDAYGYSNDWSKGGPIIEREGIEISKGNPLYFPQGNEHGDHYEPLWLAGKQHGPTPLIAAMRCYVASKLSDEVEIPEELK